MAKVKDVDFYIFCYILWIILVFQHSVRGVYFVVIILFYSIFYLLTETLLLRYFTIIVLLAYLTKGSVSFWIDVSSILSLLQF